MVFVADGAGNQLDCLAGARSRRPTKQGRSVEGGTGVGPANEPPMV
jgi:hypothetical protein